MRQLTLRVDDGLAARLKAVAGDRGESVNRYAEAVLSAAVDPELAGSEADRLRERLARAGLLVIPEPRDVRRPGRDELVAARAAAGRGKPLSEMVSEGRG